MTATETWTGTDGAAWPSQWTTTGNATIVGNRGRLLPAASSFANSTALLSGMTASSTADLTVDIQPVVADADTRIHVSTQAVGINAPFPVTGYNTRLNYYANGSVDINLFRWENQSSSSGGAVNRQGVGFTAPWRLRMQVTGGVVKVKFWLASGTEPTPWDITFTDSTPLGAGKILLASETPAAASRGADFDNLNDTAGAPPDTTAPTVPTNLMAAPGNGQVGLSWTMSTDAVGVTGYKVYRDNALVTSVTGTTYTDTGRTNGTQYAYQVSAVDAAGNESARTAAVNATPAVGGSTITVTDANLIYSPYNWSASGGVASTISGGAYVRGYVIGNPADLTATFDVTTTSGSPRLAIYVDHILQGYAALAANVTISLSGFGKPKHLVELVLHASGRGAAQWTTPVKFTGFKSTTTGVTTTVTRRRPRNVLAFGDSILNGYLTGGPGGGQSDTRYGWAWTLRNLLGCEIGTAGYEGQGWNNGGDGAVPAFTAAFDKVFSGTARSFTTPVEPDLVVINLGQNDNTDVTSAAIAVCNAILAATTSTKIALVQPFGATAGAARRAALQAAQAGSSTPARVAFIDTNGWLDNADTSDGTHPEAYVNIAELAPRLALQLAPLLGGAAFTPKRFINRGGTVVAIG